MDRSDLDPLRRVRREENDDIDQPICFEAGDTSSLVVYLVYVLPKKLLFIKLAVGNRGDAGDLPKVLQNPDGGLTGGIAVWNQMKAVVKVACKKRKIEQASVEELQAMARYEDCCFEATGTDTADLVLEPAGRWSEHAGKLRLTHAKMGTLSLWLYEAKDVKTVKKHLPKVFGDEVRLNA